MPDLAGLSVLKSRSYLKGCMYTSHLARPQQRCVCLSSPFATDGLPVATVLILWY